MFLTADVTMDINEASHAFREPDDHPTEGGISGGQTTSGLERVVYIRNLSKAIVSVDQTDKRLMKSEAATTWVRLPKRQRSVVFGS